MLDAVSKSTPSMGMVHRDRPLNVRRKDDPGTDPMNPDTVEPGLEEGIQDPFDYRDLNEDHIPTVKYDPDQPRDDRGRFGSMVTGSGWFTKGGVFIPVSRYGHDNAARDNGLADGKHASYKAIRAGHARIMVDDSGHISIEASPKGLASVKGALNNMAFPDDRGIDLTTNAGSNEIGSGRVNHSGTLDSARTWIKARIAGVSKSDDKKDDDPGTQDVDPPNQSAVDIGPLDVIVPQDSFGPIEKRISGNSPISLNVEGRKLANKLADRIATKGCLDVIYSSTLPRGIETVEPILKACPTTKYAGPQPDLCPWKLGVYEGKEPDDVKGQIVYFIEHPDEVPPGKGADGEPAESFNVAKERQLSFFRKVYTDYTNDPTLKIGIQTHSRGQELLQAWVDADCPDDYDLDEKDVIHPDDQPHATMMRWHKDDIKDIDLDSDDPLKPGVYLILHSLTDDDTDGGNPELEKFDADQPRDDHGRFGSAQIQLGIAQDEHDRLKEHPGREDDNASAAAKSNFSRGVYALGDKVRALAAKPAFNVKINRSGDKARPVIMNHIARGDKARADAVRDPEGGAWKMDMALSHYHDAILTAGRVLGSKWVGKSAGTNHMLTRRVYMPPIEVHRAAKSAIDAGVSVIDVTYPLAESQGLDLEHVQMVADFFAASESATAPMTTRNAYGGVNAVKWAAKVIAKAHKEYSSWYGCDLDGTLCKPAESYDGTAIGAPIRTMVDKVKSLIASGKEVRIFTARVADDVDGKKEAAIKAWCKTHIGRELPVTNEKDPGMVALWDDRAHNADEINKAGSGVMVAFMLDAATADKLKVPGGEDPKDMHVTLAYLGKLDTLDMSTLPGLEQAIKSYAAMHAPVTGTIDGPIRFSAKPQTEGRDVCVAAFCNPGIQEFRAGLVDAIKCAGVEVPRVFDYRPHVCIKYIPTDADMPVQRIAPMPVTFNAITLSVGGARKTYPLSGTVVKYSPDQPRADNGEFGSGSGTRAKASDRVERARKSAVLIGTKEQRQAEGVEAKLAKAIGVPQTKDNSAMDLKSDDVGIECKCLLSNANDKITMSKSALSRKVAEQRDEGFRGYTVVADLRGRSNAQYYYREGFGSFRLGSMTKVTLSELKGIVR